MTKIRLILNLCVPDFFWGPPGVFEPRWHFDPPEFFDPWSSPWFLSLQSSITPFGQREPFHRAYQTYYVTQILAFDWSVWILNFGAKTPLTNQNSQFPTAKTGLDQCRELLPASLSPSALVILMIGLSLANTVFFLRKFIKKENRERIQCNLASPGLRYFRFLHPLDDVTFGRSLLSVLASPGWRCFRGVVTFGFSIPWMTLLSGGRYFRFLLPLDDVTFGGSLLTVLASPGWRYFRRFVTFGFSIPWKTLLSGGRYFRF